MKETASHLTPPYNKLDFPNWQLVSDVYGSWNAALYNAGLMTTKEFFKTDDGVQYLLDAMKEKASHLEPPYHKYDFENGKQLTKIFGSWNNALRAAGLMTTAEITGYECCFSDAYLKKKFEELMDKLGRIPIYKEFLPYSQVCVKKYGTWKNKIFLDMISRVSSKKK